MSILRYHRGVTQEEAVNEPGSLLASTGYLLARLGMESRRVWGQMLGEHGLTPHQFGVLMTLAQLKAASQQQLSQAVGVDPRNAVPIVDSLEQRGLIGRRRDPADRRKHTITLTKAGQVQIEQLGQAGNELENWFLASLTDEERAGLHATLRKLFAAVSQAAR
jgi:DNA-binding MarR family transcriptional regulator